MGTTKVQKADISHPIKQQHQPHLEKAGSDRNLVREKSGGSTYSTTDSTAAFVKEDYLESDNMKVRLPELVRQFSAEVLGTFLLVLFGDGAIAQVVLGSNKENMDFFGNFQSIMFGYGFALMIGILVSGGVSGGHLNPAVTLAMAVLKKCSWIQVPIYMLAQYLGAFLAAAVLYGIYADGISAAGGKVDATVGIFASYPHGDGWVPSNVTLAFDQILGTALLLIIILAVTDAKNMNVSSGLVPLLIGLGLAAIHNSFGLNAGCAINPARDFSPRLLTLMAGWDSDVTFGGANNYFFWIPWLLPHIGGVLGALLYQFMIAIHHPVD